MIALREYGILTEQSDIRAHVSVACGIVYVFPTFRGIEAIRRYTPELRLAGQPGVSGPTGQGFLVKTEWIMDLVRVPFSEPFWPCFDMEMSTSEKGSLAVEVVCFLMGEGKFPFWLKAGETTNKDLQIRGTDIVVSCKKRVQVKCDWRGGDRPKGSGNLFLQKAERNPLGLT